ncbi:MAG: hypothetical protein ACREP9_07560, partial [Candidatus Dormibacteraceae bacterium]
VISGVRVKSPLEHRGVILRKLTPSEHAIYWSSCNGGRFSSRQSETDFVVPMKFSMPASTLLEITTERSRDQQEQSTLARQVALAFYLKGFDIGSNGMMATFDRPLWATISRHPELSLVDQKFITDESSVTQVDFETIVDLAYTIPKFGLIGSSNREIALYRLLRGLGMHWQELESGFLDFVISIEASLLLYKEKGKTYKFRDRGAKLICNKHDQEQTKKQFENVYDVRSRGVHSGVR